MKKRNVFVSSNVEAYYNINKFDNSIRVSSARLNIDQLKIALNIIYEEILRLAII